ISLMQSRAGLYAQMRLIDNKGIELIRVENRPNGLQVAQTESLQNKSSRYYLKQSLELKDDEIYLSPFDLNVERGRIVRPHEPSLRFGATARDSSGVLRGVLVINYLGNELIDRLRAIGTSNGMEFWLVNGHGHWLIGPRSDEEWAFMFPGGWEHGFNSDQPEIWSQLQDSAGDTRFFDRKSDALLSARLFNPSEHLPSAGIRLQTDPKNHWYLITNAPAEQIEALRAPYIQRTLLIGLLLALLFAVISAWIARQISRRRLAQLAVRNSEQLFRSLMEAAPDAVVITDSDGRINMVNRRAEEEFRAERSALIGQSVDNLLPERFRSEHRQHRQNYLLDARPRAMGDGRELLARRLDGEEFPVSIALNSVESDQGTLVISVIRDHAPRLKREKERSRLLEILDHSSDFIGGIDMDGRIVSHNHAGARMLGLSSRIDLSGEPIDRIQPYWAARLVLDEGIPKALKEERWEAETALLHRDGHEIPVRQQLVLHRKDNGEPDYFSTIMHDLTELKRLCRKLAEKEAGNTA
ncbi:MAG: PAS domain S-box protein, partial [Gammaproteobacteria bacterium]